MLCFLLSLACGAEQPPCFEASHPAPTDSFSGHYNSSENPAVPGSLDFTTDGYDTFPEQQLNRTPSEAELLVKLEEEPDESAAPLDSGCKFEVEEAEGEVWASTLGSDVRDPSFSYDRQQFEQIPSALSSQSGLLLEDMEPKFHSVEKSHFVVLSAARAKRRARTFCFKRPQQDEGHSALSLDQSAVPPPTQHQYKDSPQLRSPNEDLMSPSAVLVSSCHSRSSFGVARWMRTPWRTGIGEKRFSCTYCDKSFMRFSQLKEHLRSHTGEKPFSCTQCGRSFTKQCNLIRHAVVHSGEKPYECSLCGKCFTQRSSLKSHQKTAH